MSVASGCIESLKEMRNTVDQIQEINQSLGAIGREIVEELNKILKMNNKPFTLENFNGREAVVHPNSFILIQDKEGNVSPRQLNDLEPLVLFSVLKELIPKLKSSLDVKKQLDESLMENLSKIRDLLV